MKKGLTTGFGPFVAAIICDAADNETPVSPEKKVCFSAAAAALNTLL